MMNYYEPWESDYLGISDSRRGRIIARVSHEGVKNHIVAAVNACAGIPTAALEAGVVGEMVEALRAFVEAWEKSHQLVKTDVAHRKARAILAKLDQEGSE